MEAKKKVLIAIFAGKETHEGMGRVANALVMAKELRESGHHVDIIFDGAGTEWLAELQDESSRIHGLYHGLEGSVKAVCEFCAGSFNVRDALRKAKAPLSGEYMGHPSFEKYIRDDYKIITF